MKVYLKRKRIGVNATGEFDPTTRSLIVLSGSIVSKDVAHSEKFRGAKTIERTREGIIQDCILQKDIAFKSPSTAGNFVTGRSVNGLVTWKAEDGRTVKEILTDIEVKA